MAGSYHLIDLSSSDDVIYISASTLEFENPNQNITNQNRDAKLEEDIKHAVEKSFIEVKTINMFKCKKN